MNEGEAKSELERLQAEHPGLLALLRSTPAPADADTGTASADEVLAARALAILGSAKARSPQEVAGTVKLTPGELQLMLDAVADLREPPTIEIQLLRDEVDKLRASQLTADGVRVLVAKMFAGTLVVGAAIAAIVGAVVSIA